MLRPGGRLGLIHHLSLQPNPYDGPTGPRWKKYIAGLPGEIEVFQHSIPMLENALSSMRAAEAKVAPRGKEELAYMICRTEAYRDAMQAEITERQAFLAFDHAFQTRSAVSRVQFESNLDASLKQFEAAHEQAEVATRKYAEIIDYPSDLEDLYRLNTAKVMSFDFITQWVRTIVNFNEGKPYGQHVPFERLFTGNVYIAPWH